MRGSEEASWPGRVVGSQAHLPGRLAKGPLKGGSDLGHDKGAVGKGKVGSRRHGSQVALPFGALDGHAGQLAVHQFDVGSGQGTVGGRQEVGADLQMEQTSLRQLDNQGRTGQGRAGSAWCVARLLSPRLVSLLLVPLGLGTVRASVQSLQAQQLTDWQVLITV